MERKKDTMVNPTTNQFEAMSEALRAKLTPEEQKKRAWTRFEEGEIIIIKGVRFEVHEIGEKRLVLKFA
jgi:hypothetical protein